VNRIDAPHSPKDAQFYGFGSLTCAGRWDSKRLLKMSLELHNLAAKQVGVKCFFRNPNSFYHMDLGACLVLLGPKGAIQGPVLNGLADVLGFDRESGANFRARRSSASPYSSPREHRCGYQYGRAGGRKFSRCSAESWAACSGTRGFGH